MQFTCIIFHIDPTCFGIIISPSSGSRKQSFFKIYMSILTYILNKFFLQPSQDSDTITPKNVEAMYRVLRINDRIVHLLVLHEIVLRHIARNKQCTRHYIHVTVRRYRFLS